MSLISDTKSSSTAIHGEYYPHIDGIRALAVLPVVLFHVLAVLCPGGFAGVDVFFVISGYLITGGILRDLKEDRFTIRNFYYRRIRRIIPAYFVMIIGVFAIGCSLYYATPLRYLGDAVTAGTLFLANIHFREMGGDYFAPGLHSQALLHLWSLSVEEQFYLFIPLLCASIWKFRRRLVAPVLSLLAVISFAGAIYAVVTGKQNDAFYLLHLRAWELLSGSLLAMLPAAPTAVASTTACRRRAGSASIGERHSFFATVGFLMVVIPYAVISSKTPFPGAAALSPVIGTALLIRYGQSGMISRLLSCRPFVAIGKISYSLYLWHWPVTVFWKYSVYDQLYAYDYIGMLLLSLVLGYLSWKFVESPVRISPFWTMRRSFAFATTGIILLVVLGTACTFFKGWPKTLHSSANEWAGAPDPLLVEGRIQSLVRHIDSKTGLRLSIFNKSIREREALIWMWGRCGRSTMGVSDRPEVLLIGDSHAACLQYGLDTVLRGKNTAGYIFTSSATPMYNMNRSESLAALRKLDEMTPGAVVLLAQHWRGRFSEERNKPADIELAYVQLEEFASCIKSKGRTLLIVEDVPTHKWALNDIAARMQIISPRKTAPEWKSFQQSEEQYNLRNKDINDRLGEICKRTGAIFVPLHLAFNENGRYVYFDRKNKIPLPLYKDSGHLSPDGSLRAAQFISSWLFPATAP